MRCPECAAQPSPTMRCFECAAAAVAEWKAARDKPVVVAKKGKR